MGIYSITDSAMAGLNIAQAGILTTSQNVAGTTVEGYSRRNANVIMDSLAPNSLMLNGSSFAVEGFTRHHSSLIGSQLLIQQSKSSYSDTLVEFTRSIDSLIADKSTGLNSALSSFFNTMGAYAADPTNRAMAGAITGAANVVAQRVTGMSEMTTQIKTDARTSLTETVAQINTILPALANINQRIIDGNSPGVSAPSADLLDERDRLLAKLQQLVGGQTLINSNGTATQLVAGMPLVERSIANKVTINADQEHIALTFNLQNGPNKGILQTVQKLDGGQAGALLKLANEFVPSIEKRLDVIALSLVKVANGAAQPVDSAGKPIAGSTSNLPIFGFKVGANTFSNLASNDLSGLIPNIASELDMQNLYSSLGNAISANSEVKVGTSAGEFTSITSATAAEGITDVFTFADLGDGQIKLSSSSGKSQILSISDSINRGSQTLDFSQLGIVLELGNLSGSLSAVSNMSDIQAEFTLPSSTTQLVSAISINSNVQSAEYTFTNLGNGQLELTGLGKSQTITLESGKGEPGQLLNFDELGIQLTITGLDTGGIGEEASSIAAYFAGQKLKLTDAVDTKETIASALDGKTIGASGISDQLSYYGLKASNFISVAPANFASYFNGNNPGTPYITSEAANRVQKMSSVFGIAVSNMVNDVGVQVAMWKNGQKADSVVLANLKAQRDSVSGVNLDEEAANLLRYQQLYTASTKVMQAGNQMFTTLLSIMN
jgi:flagellar hook-associated protein 1 FlgK